MGGTVFKAFAEKIEIIDTYMFYSTHIIDLNEFITLDKECNTNYTDDKELENWKMFLYTVPLYVNFTYEWIDNFGNKGVRLLPLKNDRLNKGDKPFHEYLYLAINSIDSNSSQAKFILTTNQKEFYEKYKSKYIV